MLRKIVFKFTIFVLLISSSAFAGESSNIYFIENVSANAISKTPKDAKTIASNGARRDAFLILLTRLSMSSLVADSVSNDDIFDMIVSEQINDEKIAGSNYSATFGITFSKSAVDRILKAKTQKGNAITKDSDEESYLIVPVKMVKRTPPDRYLLWESTNEWRPAMMAALRDKSITRFVVPDDDIANIAVLNHDNIDTIEFSRIETMLSRYDASAAYIAFFYYDNSENKVSITLQNIRKMQKRQVKLSFANTDRLPYDELLKKVSGKLVEYLLSSKSADNIRSNAKLIKIEVPITSLGNWLMIRNKLEASNLISQLNIDSISRDYVEITVNYVDSRIDIIDSFTKAGFVLDKKGDDLYSLTLSPSANKDYDQ